MGDARGEAFLPDGKAPEAGTWWRFPAQARTLREIAETGGESFYRGNLAKQIADHARATGGAITEADLAAHEAEWVEPISQEFRGYRLNECPPSGQGIAALMALGILERFDIESMGLDSADYYHVSIEAMKLAFADLHHHVTDPRHMRVSHEALLDPAYLAERAKLISMDRAAVPLAGAPKSGGTVYLTAADAAGTMVSFIQSNYHGFGSGVVVPNTGISLHNRGLNFVLTPGHVNQVAPRKKPMHTIIPAFVTKDGAPVMSYGVMGGSMQAQGHLQMMTRLAAFNQNPQAMCDAPRFRVEPGPVVNVESHLPADVVAVLRERGHNVAVAAADSLEFGSAQLIYRMENGYFAASDGRRDGQAVGF
jgi:gamma-glutamyltranspeptidase/glutathione hydrolase